MRNVLTKGLLGVAALALLLNFAGAGIALAECDATFADVVKIPGEMIFTPGDFLHRVLTAPAGKPAWYHDLTASKPAVNMRWGAPHPLLCEERMR